MRKMKILDTSEESVVKRKIMPHLNPLMDETDLLARTPEEYEHDINRLMNLAKDYIKQRGMWPGAIFVVPDMADKPPIAVFLEGATKEELQQTGRVVKMAWEVMDELKLEVAAVYLVAEMWALDVDRPPREGHPTPSQHPDRYEAVVVAAGHRVHGFKGAMHRIVRGPDGEATYPGLIQYPKVPDGVLPAPVGPVTFKNHDPIKTPRRP